MAKNKNSLPGTRLAHQRPDLIGKAGEYAYAIRAGCRLPETWVAAGWNDHGVDVGDVDIKAVRFQGYGCEYFLKSPVNYAIQASWLALTVVDAPAQRASVLGRIRREKFRSIAKVMTFNSTMGPQYIVSEFDLDL